MPWEPGNGFWSVPRFLEGRTVAIIATGPSLSQGQVDLCRAAGIAAIAVNNGYEYAPWAQAVYAADYRWWQTYWQAGGLPGRPGVKDFKGLKITTEPPYRDSVFRVGNSGRDGFDPDPSFIRTGGNSGFQAVHIAAHAGARRILLLGCDCRPGPGGREHIFGSHPGSCRKTDQNGTLPFNIFLQHWPSIVPGLRERNIEIYNCTPGSAIHCFERRDLSEVLNG